MHTQRISSHKQFLDKLQASSPKDRRAQIVRAKAGEIRAIVEIVLNFLKGNLPVKDPQVFRKHRHKLRTLINKCCSQTVKKKNSYHIKPQQVGVARQLLNQQRGGFLPFLIPLIAAAGPLIAKAALAGAVSTGVGLGIKKLAGS